MSWTSTSKKLLCRAARTTLCLAIIRCFEYVLSRCARTLSIAACVTNHYHRLDATHLPLRGCTIPMPIDEWMDMFERYTERARRVIFFARYEASQFGSMTIESEHLLLGLLREDKNVISRFLRNTSFTEIRDEITGRMFVREKVATSIDLPLSHECKRILAYAAEETERLNHLHIGTEHLLLGILREERCVASQILYERGLNVDAV